MATYWFDAAKENFSKAFAAWIREEAAKEWVEYRLEDVDRSNSK